MKHAGASSLQSLWRFARIKGACPSGKVAHPSMLRADDAAEKLNGTPADFGPRVLAKSYYCRHCGGWHVGRPPQDWAKHRQRRVARREVAE